MAIDIGGLHPEKIFSSRQIIIIGETSRIVGIMLFIVETVEFICITVEKRVIAEIKHGKLNAEIIPGMVKGEFISSSRRFEGDTTPNLIRELMP